jgi:thiamine pyrophosphate-dependent acetolactate synthase large subunit-like protein
VHLELPEDIAAEEVDEKFIKLNLETMKQRRPILDEKGLDVLKNEIAQAKSPIILI